VVNGNTSVLHDLNLRIDADDRIALLGRQPARVKSTLSKMLSERAELARGTWVRPTSCAIGFSPAQVDEPADRRNPAGNLLRERAEEAKRTPRRALPALPLALTKADPRGPPVGGQKARLSLPAGHPARAHLC